MNKPIGWSRQCVRDLILHHASGPSPTCEERNIASSEEWGLLKTTAVTWDGWNSAAHKVPPHEFWANGSLEVHAGDVLITKAGPRDRCGVTVYVLETPPRLMVSGKMILLRPDNSKTNAVILASALATDTSQRFLDSRTTGMADAQMNFTNQLLLDMEVNIPPLDEQLQISRILMTLDETIEQTEALIAKMQQVKAGLMHDLFTRGVTSDGHLRPTREQAPGLYKESPLGWIPKDWEVFDTDAKVSVIDPQPDHRTPPEVLEGFPYVGIGDITPTGELDFVRARKVAPAAFQKQLRLFEIHPGAFIFGKIGTIGQPTRIPHERFFAVSANVVLLTAKSKEDSDFTFWVYNSALTETQVADTTNTTSQPALGIQRIRKFLVPWPESPEERNQMVSRLESISQVLQVEEQNREKLCMLKQGLMHDLLTGRVRVKVKKTKVVTS